MNYIRPNQQRAKNAITLIWIVLVVEFVSFISSYFQYDLLQSVAHGNFVSLEEANANDTRELWMGIITIVSFLISAITFLSWFRRAYSNLGIKYGNLSNSDGWVIGSWFIPIISLYQPYEMMKELYEKTKKLLVGRHLIAEKNLATKHLGWWWGLWIISSIFGQVLFRLSLRAVSLNELINITLAQMLLFIVDIPLAFLAVHVIREYAKVEHLLTEVEDEIPNEPQPILE